MALRDEIQIMVVDDMSSSRGIILQTLEQIGCYNTTAESDALCAYNKIIKTGISLVISDYHMPGMDGLALLKSLRQTPRTQGIGFILVTGRADQNVVSQGKALGMNNLLQKPFDALKMKSCIEAVVGKL